MAERSSTRTASRRTTPQPAPEAGRTTAPQGSPKPITRTTRSQSRDISDSEDGRKGARAHRGARQTISEDADVAAEQSTTKSRRGKTVNRSRAIQDLPTVTEDPSVVYPNLEIREEENAEQVGEGQPAGQPSKSPGGASAFSGTTARNSLSARELLDMNSEEMLDALPDLADASNKILSFLVRGPLSEAVVADIVTELQIKSSRANKNLRRLGSTFQVQKDIYGGDSYINPRGALRILLGTKTLSDIEAAQWRPDVLLQKANLAVLASSVLSHPVQEKDDQIIEELEQAFPISFLEGFVQSEVPTTGSSALLLETFRLAIEIRTQYAIRSLARHAGRRNFDSDEILRQVFYKNDHSLKGWAVFGLRAEDLKESFQDAVLQRLEGLRDAFADAVRNPMASIDDLKSDYPWATFTQQTIAWIGHRLSEINKEVELHGSAEEIHENLSNEIQRRRLAEPIIGDHGDDDASPQLVLDYELPSEVPLTISNQHENSRLAARTKALKISHFSSNSPKAWNVMKGLKGRLKGPRAANQTQLGLPPPAHQSASNFQVASTAGPSTVVLPVALQADEPVIPASAPAQISDEQQEHPQQDDGWRHQENDENDEDLVLGSDEDRLATATLALKAKNDAESNKENIAEVKESRAQLQPQSIPRRLIDPQKGAVKISFESQDSNVDNQIEDVSQDEGFQEQVLPVNSAQRRISHSQLKRQATDPARLQGRSPKKARLQEPSGSRSQAPAKVRVEKPPAPPRSQTIVEDRNEDEPNPTQMDGYKAANAAAKEKKAFQVKPTQIRIPWSEEETERLHELIVKHGVSWKLLKQEDQIWRGGPMLEDRDQGALKDKARNIKMDYLKAARCLPENFYRIAISKIQIERLKSENIIYDKETGQREDALVVDAD